jgi:peroxiredoxin
MAKAAAGSIAPDFDLETDGGGRIRLSDLAGKSAVLYFYPKDDTSGCTLEAIDFTKAAKAFAAAGATVIGISPDTVKSHDKFKKKHNLGIVLAADPDKTGHRGLWRLGREEHVRPQVHGRRTRHVPHRPRPPNQGGMAEGQGSGPCRGGPGGGPGSLT